MLEHTGNSGLCHVPFLPIVIALMDGSCQNWGWLNPRPTESWSRSDSKV